MHIAIIIDIFGIPLVSEIGVTFAFNVVSVVVFCVNVLGFMVVVVVRVLSFVVVNFGRIVVVTMRTFVVGFSTNVGTVCIALGLNGVVEDLTTGFAVVDVVDVVDVTLIHFSVLGGTFVGTVLVRATVVFKIAEFLVGKLFDVVGIGVVDFGVDFVVVEFKFMTEILIVAKVTFNRSVGIVIVFGVVVFLEIIVEVEVLIVVKVTIVFGVVISIVEFCIPLPFPCISINGVVVTSSDGLFSDDSSLNGVVVKSNSVGSSKKCLKN